MLDKTRKPPTPRASARLQHDSAGRVGQAMHFAHDLQHLRVGARTSSGSVRVVSAPFGDGPRRVGGRRTRDADDGRMMNLLNKGGRVAKAILAARDMLRLNRDVGEGCPSARRELLAEAVPIIDNLNAWRFGCDHRGNRLVSVVHGADVDPIGGKGAVV
jgi:hypothetical protein